MDGFMDDFFEGIGNGSSQESFDLAALQFFHELDQRAEKASASPRPEPEKPEAPKQVPPEDEVMTDLADTGLDSLILQMMADTEPRKAPAPPRNPSSGRLTRPVPRKKPAEPAPPKPAEQSQGEAPLSDLALSAARLFDTLPTQDRLLAYTLLEKLAKAAER